MYFNSSKIKERRKKRRFMPFIYFVLEIILIWLVFVIVEISYNPLDWDLWTYIISIIGIAYSFMKMLHIYDRQKSYKEEKSDT